MFLDIERIFLLLFKEKVCIIVIARKRLYVYLVVDGCDAPLPLLKRKNPHWFEVLNTFTN